MKLTRSELKQEFIPGDDIIQCNAQDVSKKSLKKGRSNCLFVLPAQLAISKGGGGGKEEVLAYMQKMSSPSPELVVETHEAEVVFVGKYLAPSSSLFALTLCPKKASSFCEDLFDRVLLFQYSHQTPKSSIDEAPYQLPDGKFSTPPSFLVSSNGDVPITPTPVISTSDCEETERRASKRIDRLKHVTYDGFSDNDFSDDSDIENQYKKKRGKLGL